MGESLVTFFITDIITSIVTIIIQILMAKYAIYSEVKGRKTSYTYLQAQAKCPALVDCTEDYMGAVLSFGFMCMFGVVCPIMAFLSMLCNSLQIRLFAYRIVWASQRP